FGIDIDSKSCRFGGGGSIIFDYDTEVAITRAKSRLSRPDVEMIVNIVRGLRESGKCEFAPTVRGCIMIAKTLKVQNLTPRKSSRIFMQMCQDILASETSRVGSKTNQNRVKEIVRELVTKEIGLGNTILSRLGCLAETDDAAKKTENSAKIVAAVDYNEVENKREKKQMRRLVEMQEGARVK
ncbi:MAG: hypothetical protein NT055_00630, partial [Nitrospirae bacterium]|nr:hypothetical protein [Nitrospirota bacterium]